ncbi:proton-conducting transporter membrane subunit, partial [Thermodesulfobacteriota bacterium]
MGWLLILPIIIPLGTAVFTFLTCSRTLLQGVAAVIGSTAQLIVGLALLVHVNRHGIQAVQIGNWPAPFGISFVADHFSAIMVVIAAIIALSVVFYSLNDVDDDRVCLGHQPLLQILIAGISGAFLTGDIFNLYVWFEVMLMASFALLVHGGTPQQIESAVKYVALNLLATIMFISAVGLLYSMTGSLNMAELHLKVQEIEKTGLLSAIALMFMCAFGIKSALFPLFFWLPAAYHTPSVFVSAIFAGLLTKVGVYSLIRVFTLIFTRDISYTHSLLLIIAGLTMLTGVLGAAARNEFRRILSFHIISQVGYMVMGLALFTPLGIAGAIFYLIHHILVKANLFLISGVVQRLKGSFELEEIGGVYKSAGLLSLLFFVPAFSLAGFPPLSGFWAKMILIKACLEIEQYTMAATAAVVGLLTVYSMTKLWGEAFWKPHPSPSAAG